MTKHIFEDDCDQTEIAYPLSRAFVIQFHAGSAPGGRVEHVASGSCIRFNTAEQLLDFMSRILARSSAPAETWHVKSDKRTSPGGPAPEPEDPERF